MTPILIDCDGVLSDFVRHVATFTGADAEECREWDIRKWLTEEQLRRFNSDVGQPGWCESMPVYPDALECVDKLRGLAVDSETHLLCVTGPFAGSRHWHHERTEWLVRHFGFLRSEVLFVDKEHKVRVNGCTLIEDHEDTATRWWAHTDLPTYVVARPWNEDVLPRATAHRGPLREITSHIIARGPVL